MIDWHMAIAVSVGVVIGQFAYDLIRKLLK